MHTEPRSETIARHVREALNTEGRLTDRAFAERVMADYHARTPLHLRTISFEQGNTTDTVERAQRANAQTIRRFLDGAVRLPADIEESMVAALPDAIRERCLVALAARYGLLAVAAPTGSGTEQVQRMASLLHSTGDAVGAIAPMLADGVIDEADHPHARRALDELTRVVTAATTLQAQIAPLLHTPIRTSNVHALRA